MCRARVQAHLSDIARFRQKLLPKLDLVAVSRDQLRVDPQSRAHVLGGRSSVTVPYPSPRRRGHSERVHPSVLALTDDLIEVRKEIEMAMEVYEWFIHFVGPSERP